MAAKRTDIQGRKTRTLQRCGRLSATKTWHGMAAVVDVRSLHHERALV